MSSDARRSYLLNHAAQTIAQAMGADVASVRFRDDGLVEVIIAPNPQVPYWSAVIEQMQADTPPAPPEPADNDAAKPEITEQERQDEAARLTS